MKKVARNYYNRCLYYYIGLITAVLVLDRISKALILQTHAKIITSWLAFEPSLNRGFSWSLLASEHTGTFLVVSSCVLLFFLLFNGYTFYRIRHNLPVWGEALIIGGALSNLIDRLVYHGVVDFIVLSWKSWAWPSFNIADAAICLGALIMLIQTLREK